MEASMSEKRNYRNGFTLAETLIVVAIVIILAGLAFVAVFSYQRNLMQFEYDGIAKEIFVAAQNHLSIAKGDGSLTAFDDSAFGTEEKDGGGNGTGIYYFVVDNAGGVSATDPDSTSTALYYMLPFASVDETARSGGSYIIRYNREEGLILDVFYSSKSDGRFGHTFTSSEYDSLISGYTGEEHKNDRKKYTDNSVIGYYGGVEAQNISHTDVVLAPPTIEVVNADKLTVRVHNSVDLSTSSSAAIQIRLIVTGKTSGNSKYVTLMNNGSAVGSYSEDAGVNFTVDLDDITKDGGHFSELFGTETAGGSGFVGKALIPGEDIEIKAVAFSNTVFSNVAQSDVKLTNSLFAASSNAAGGRADISNVRHLENLGKSFSELGKNSTVDKSVAISSAEQTTDLDWNGFLTGIGKNNVYDADGNAYANGCFAPVNLEAPIDYNGNGYSITGVKVSIADDAGLFGELSTGSRVSNLHLIDFDIESTNGSAGALAGTAYGSDISGVVVNNDSLKDDSSLEIKGTESVGGLLGSVNGCSVDACAASVYVKSTGGSAGGLVGTLSGNSEISDSYSGGHTEDGVYLEEESNANRINVIAATSAGGLVGTANGSNIMYSYSTCSAKGAAAGGLVGGAGGTASVTVSNCYSTGLVSATQAGAFIGSAGTVSLSSNNYFSIINEKMQAVGNAADAVGVSAFDRTVEAYSDFTVNDTPAFAYAPSLIFEFNGKSDMPDIVALHGGSYGGISAWPEFFTEGGKSLHYGDWPTPETKVVNMLVNKALNGLDASAEIGRDPFTGYVALKYDDDSSIPGGASLSAERLRGSANASLINEAAEKLGISPKILSVDLIDISILDGDTKVQPSGEVDVSIQLSYGSSRKANDIHVVHFAEDGAEILDSKVEGNVLSFKTDSFSVYAIITNEGGEIKEPRVEFHFIGSDFDDNGDGTYTAEAYEFINTGDDKDTTGHNPTNVQTSQILKNSEALENIPNPANLVTYAADNTTVLSSKYFFGWYQVNGVTVDGEGNITYRWNDSPEQILLEKAITIGNIVWNNDDPSNSLYHTAITSMTWTMNGVSHTVSSSEVDEYGVVHVYLAPIYEDYYFVNFHLGAKESAKDEFGNWDSTGLWSNLLTRRLIVLGDDGIEEVHIGLSAPPMDAKRQVFAGWETVTTHDEDAEIDDPLNPGNTQTLTIHYPLDRVNLYETVDPITGVENNSAGHTDGYYITIKRNDQITSSAYEVMGDNKSIDLYPVFAEARWIYFNIGKSGNGATYVGAKYLLTSDNIVSENFTLSSLPGKNANNVTGDSAVKRNGYEFNGWYYGAVRDADGNIANLNGSYTYTDPETHESVTVPQAILVADENGNLVNGVGEVKNDENETIFKIQGGKLYVYKALDELTLYADWEEIEDATIQINVWRQKVTDDKNAAESEKAYDYVREYSYKIEAHSGWTLAQVRSNNKLHVGGTVGGTNVESLTEQGFSYVKTTMSSDTVAGNGSTVVNVYYDRDLITFNFHTYGTRVFEISNADVPVEQYALINGVYVLLTRGAGESVTVWRPQYTYTSTTSDGTDLYGIVDGEYVPLTRVPQTSYVTTNGNQYNYTVSTSGTSGTFYGIYNGAIGQISYRTSGGYWRTGTSGSTRYNGERYTRDQQNRGTTPYTGTVYHVANNGFSTSGSGALYGVSGTTYFPITETTSYTYTYGGGTAYNGTRYARTSGGNVYTGTRYTKDGSTYTATTGNDGTQYGIDANGVYVLIESGTETVYKWYTPEYGDIYTPTVSDGDDLYGKIDDEYVGPLVRTPTYTNVFKYKRYDETTSNSGTQYALVNGEYVPLSYELTGSSTTYTIAYVYTVSNSTSNGEYYIPINGQMTETQLYRNNNRWYRSRSWAWIGYNYSDEWTGSIYTRSDGNNATYDPALQRYTLSGSDFNPTDATTGTLYGMNGTTIYQLTPSTTNTYTWLLNGNPYDGTRYTLTDTDVTYTGTRYSRDGDVYTATDAETDGLYGVDPRGGHVALSMSNSLTGYAYSYNGNTYTGTRYTKSYGATGNNIEYTGVRWVEGTASSGWHIYKVFTGLYGQTLEQNGYVWDTAYDWYNTGGNNGTASGTRTTFLDAFLPTETADTVNFYGNAAAGGSRDVVFLKQDLDNPNNYTEANRVATSGTGSFNISDKYNGFTAYQYRVNGGAWTNVGAKNDSTGYYGSSVSYSSTLEIRFNRNVSSITFVTQYPGLADLWDEGGTPSEEEHTVYDISYGTRIDSYAKGGANYWQPNVPPHYTFDGWYADAAGTVPYNFNTTMPANDLIVYGKWTPEEFLIKIDPNGGVIDHVNHWGANELEFTAAYSGRYVGSRYSVYDFPTFRPNPGAVTDIQKYDPNQATFFWNDYNQPISEYATLVRDYVEITQTEANAMRAAYEEATTDEEREKNTVFYYLNTQYNDPTEQLSIQADARNALYLTEDEMTEYFTFFRNINIARYGSCPYGADDFEGWKRDFIAHDDEGNERLYRHRNSKEFYTFVGWFQVYDDGTVSSTPYNFEDLTKSKITLRAQWRLDGGYIIQYTPEQTLNGKLINGDMIAWTDPITSEGTYTDGAKTSIYRQPDNITEDGDLENGAKYDFIGWRLVSVKTGAGGTTIYVPLEGHSIYEPGDTVYQPGDDWTVKASYADANSIIHMQAVYQLKVESVRRPEVINLTLDANEGYLLNEGGSELLSDTNPTWSRPGVVTMHADSDTITFGDIQSNIAVHLYEFATNIEKDAQGATLGTIGHNYFKHNAGYLLIGFDKIKDEGDYAADFDADSVISLSRTDNQTLYAVWEPMVYVTFKNQTKDPVRYINGGPVTFTLSSTSSEALTVINIKNGMYDRVPLESLPITLDVGEELTLAVPLGKEKDITVSGVNNIGVGSILYVNSTVETPYTSTLRTGDPAEVVADNTKAFSLTDILVEHEKGLVVTFTSAMHERTIVFDQNFGENETSEEYFTHQSLSEMAASVHMPYTNTNFGFELQGWALTRDAEEPYHNAERGYTLTPEYDLSGADLTDFFGDDYVKELYAVWKGREEAGHVYVYKLVPAPGSLNEEFSYYVNIAGRFAYQNYEGETYSVSESGIFKLKSGEYADVHISQWQGRSRYDDNPEKAYLRFEVKVYYYDDENEIWVEDTSRGFTRTAFAEKEDVGHFEIGHYDFSIEELPVTYYTPSLVITSQMTKESEYKITWAAPEVGGTARFTNTHQTYDVTVEKTVVPATDETYFSFTASYKLKNDPVVNLGSFSLAGGYQHTLEGIPAGAILTVTETANQNFVTVARAESGRADQDTESPYVFKYAVTSDDTVRFTNTLKSFPVRIVLQGFDGTNYYHNVNADFTLTKGTSTIFSMRRVNSANLGVAYNTGVRFGSAETPDAELYIGEYTLDEVWLETQYLALTKTFGFVITKDGVTLSDAPSGVVLSTEGSGTETVYVITITNRRTVPVTINKILNDPLISTTLDFYFTVSYYLDGAGFPFTSTVKVTSSDNQMIRIPTNSRLVIAEDTSRTVNDQPISSRYDTTYRIGTEDIRTGNSLTIARLLNDTKVTFTNTFKSSDITIKKIVQKNDDTNIFTFTVTMSVGMNPIRQYTLFDGGTPDDDTDDLVTDDSGRITFELSRDQTRTLSIPIGARLTVAETAARTTADEDVNLATYTTTVSAASTEDDTEYSVYQYTQSAKTMVLTSVPGVDLTLTFKNGFGVDVRFKKIDGFGHGVGGAVFTLYETYDGAYTENANKVVRLTVNEMETTSVVSASAAVGTVEIGDVDFKVPTGTWYVKETGNPDDAKYENNNNIYKLVVVSSDNISIKLCIDADTTEDIPNISLYGILNISKDKRKVIFKKTDDDFNPLEDAKLDILRYDMTLAYEDLVSFENGVFWVGDLPYGYYYLHEKEYPTDTNGDPLVQTNGDAGWWYTVKVDENGVEVMYSRQTSPKDPNDP